MLILKYDFSILHFRYYILHNIGYANVTGVRKYENKGNLMPKCDTEDTGCLKAVSLLYLKIP